MLGRAVRRGLASSAAAQPACAILPLATKIQKRNNGNMPELMEAQDPKFYQPCVKHKVRVIQTVDHLRRINLSDIGNNLPRYRAVLTVETKDLNVLHPLQKEIFIRIAGPRYNKEKGIVTFSCKAFNSHVVRYTLCFSIRLSVCLAFYPPHTHISSFPQLHHTFHYLSHHW